MAFASDNLSFEDLSRIRTAFNLKGWTILNCFRTQNRFSQEIFLSSAESRPFGNFIDFVGFHTKLHRKVEAVTEELIRSHQRTSEAIYMSLYFSVIVEKVSRY